MRREFELTSYLLNFIWVVDLVQVIFSNYRYLERVITKKCRYSLAIYVYIGNVLCTNNSVLGAVHISF